MGLKVVGGLLLVVMVAILFISFCGPKEEVSWEDYYPPFEDFGVTEPAPRVASIPLELEQGTFYRCIGYFTEFDASVINEWKRDTAGQFHETNRFEFPGRVWPC